MPPDDVQTAADLYVLGLDRFTEARDELAKRLRSDGDDEEASRVAKLRKPSVAAWALNRVARDKGELIDRLIESHESIRDASDVTALQLASEARRQAISAVVQAAADVLKADGRPDSAQTRERVTNTLLAVATDPDGEADLRAGTLVRELEPSGGGWADFGLAPPPAPDPKQRARAAIDAAKARLARIEEEAAEAERRLEIAERAVKEARRRAKELRAEAERAAEEVKRAEHG